MNISIKKSAIEQNITNKDEKRAVQTNNGDQLSNNLNIKDLQLQICEKIQNDIQRLNPNFSDTSREAAIERMKGEIKCRRCIEFQGENPINFYAKILNEYRDVQLIAKSVAPVESEVDDSDSSYSPSPSSSSDSSFSSLGSISIFSSYPSSSGPSGVEKEVESSMFPSLFLM